MMVAMITVAVVVNGSMTVATTTFNDIVKRRFKVSWLFFGNTSQITS